MRHAFRITCLFLLSLLSACQQTALPLPERTVAAIGGPERVFERPVTEIVPLLQNARATDPRGRVGGELVFWGYELAGGRSSYLVACAPLPGVDCESRLPLVCPGSRPEVLFRQEEGGEVRLLNCRAVGIVGHGDLTPNCTDNSDTQPLMVSLLSCN